MTQLPKQAFFIQLRNLIHQHFNLEEVRSLCFDLGIQYDDLPGEGLHSKIRELISRMHREQRLEDLLRYCIYQRSKVVWPTLEEDVSLDRSFASPVSPVRNPRLVFISHASQDADFARRLADDLSHQNWDIWIAPDSIRPGEQWVDAINRGLAQCSVFLLILTPEAVKSKWVQSETTVAISLQHEGMIRLIPLELKQTQMPPLWQNYQRISFYREYNSGFERLLQVLLYDQTAWREEKNSSVRSESKKTPKQQTNILAPNREEINDVSDLKERNIENSRDTSPEIIEPIFSHKKTRFYYFKRGLFSGGGIFSGVNGQSIIKAGLLGMVSNGIFAVLGGGLSYAQPSLAFISSLFLCCCGLLIPVVIGVLYSFFTPGKETLQQAFIGGSLSGAVAGIAYGILSASMMIGLALMAGAEVLDAITGGAEQLGLGCCVPSIFGFILGAVGGAIWNTVQKNR